MNRFVAATAPILMIALLGACATKPGDDPAQGNAVLGGGIDEAIAAVESGDLEVYGKVDDCVEHGMFKAYAEDPFWSKVWTDVGESEPALRDLCAEIAKDQPDAITKISSDWQAWEAFSAAGQAPSVLATVPVTPTPTVPAVAAPLPGTVPPTVLPTVPVTAPPPPVLSSPDGCHPSYDPCVQIAPDVDCKGGGNGPRYVTGPIRVIGYDEYKLGADQDGIACSVTPS